MNLSERDLLACCASPVWAAALIEGGPYDDPAALLATADTALTGLDWSEIEKALAAHPRIGERAAGESQEARWSRGEQAAVGDTSILAAANAEYERTFDRVFLINATGRSAEEILANLRARLGNDEDTERVVVREELRGIVRLRLGKALA
jgi:2-oxo-4-hydroxy-4-carboxy-5-ureidoimidazoline decarboxylase